MRKICEIKADLSGLRDGLKVHFNSAGEEYWEVKYWVNVMLGGTQLRARLVWKENVRSQVRFISVKLLLVT